LGWVLGGEGETGETPPASWGEPTGDMPRSWHCFDSALSIIRNELK